MIKRVCLLILFLLQTTSSAQAYEIVAVKSSAAEPYTLALQAFQQHFKKLSPSRGLKSIQADTVQVITLQKKESATEISQKIRAAKPDLIVAFGSKAFYHAASTYKNIAIIYLLVPSPEAVAQHSQATGVLLQPKAGVEFQALAQIFPAGRRIGVIYDPAKSADLISTTMAANRDLSFVLRSVSQAQEVAGQLATLADEVDLIWMLPDSTSLSPQAEKSYYLFSLRHKIPLLAFSEKYLTRGASFAVSLDLAGMGRWAAKLARQIQNGTKASAIKPVQIDQVALRRNKLIINKLGLVLQETSK